MSDGTAPEPAPDKASAATAGENGRARAPTLRELLPQHLPRLEDFVRSQLSRTLRDRESAADLVDSLCGDLLADGVGFEYRGEPQFESWLRTAALNKIKARMRSIGAHKRGAGRVAQATDSQVEATPCDDGSPSHEAVQREDLSLLDQALAHLPAHYRDVIVRTRLRGEPHARVAAALGRTEPAVRQLLTRALVKLTGEMDRLQNGG